MAVVTLSDDTFEQEVLKSEIPVLVDFWAVWCAPCQMISPIVDSLAEEYNDKIKVGKLNVDENSQMAQNYGVMSIPTIIVFKNGTPQKTLIGAQSKEAIKSAIDEVIS